MINLCINRRARRVLFYFLHRQNRKGKHVWLMIVILRRAMLLLFLTMTIILYLWFIIDLVISYQTFRSTFIATLAKSLPRVKEIDCNLFMAQPQMWNESLHNLSKTYIAEDAFTYNNCVDLKSSGFNIPTTDAEDIFPIAFSIIVYTDLPRFIRLLRAVYRSSNVYCINVDQKSSHAFKTKVLSLTSCFLNVFVPSEQIEIYWGSASVLEAEMLCLKALWEHQVKWLAFINLTGEEFPLKTNLELVKILQIMAGRNDVWIDPCTKDGPGDYTTADCTFLSKIGFAERWNNITALPHNIHPFKGQVHVVLSRAAVDYVLHDPKAADVYNWALKTFIPDELYFSTLNSNPSLHMPGSNPDPLVRKPSIARIKLWSYRDKPTWAHCSKYLRSVCLLTAREMPLLTTSRQLFANKFKSDYQPLGYSCLEQWYFERVIEELKTNKIHLDLTVYHRIFHHHNISA